MFGGHYIGGGDIPADLWKKLVELSVQFKEAVIVRAICRGIPLESIPALGACDVIGLLDGDHFHLVFSPISHGVPWKMWEDHRTQGVLTPEDAIGIASTRCIMKQPRVVSFIVDWICSRPLCRLEVEKLAEHYLNKLVGRGESTNL